LIAGIESASWDTQIANGATLVGTPDEIAARLANYAKAVGGFDIASMQPWFGRMPVEKAKASMRMFAREVMPRVS
jgi:alkanesulfonate monooxygenase SsuD/methylene tetrahydromethanopterin reductase-like flavin-dependent oxidoreductase (luciferase family)